jgi:hypothetical protein
VPSQLGPEEPDLRRYLRILRKRLWLIIAVVAIAGGLPAWRAMRRPPTYEAAARILLSPRTLTTDLGVSQESADPARFLETQIAVIRSAAIQHAVEAKVGRVPLAFARPTGSQDDVLEIRATSKSRTLALKAADGYAAAYLEQRRNNVLEQLDGAANEIARYQAEVQAQIANLSVTLSTVPPNSRPVVEQNLRDALSEHLSVVSQRLSYLQAKAAIVHGPPEVLDPATVGGSARSWTGAVQWLFVGLVIALALAFAVEYLRSGASPREEPPPDEQRAEAAAPTSAVGAAR